MRESGSESGFVCGSESGSVCGSVSGSVKSTVRIPVYVPKNSVNPSKCEFLHLNISYIHL